MQIEGEEGGTTPLSDQVADDIAAVVEEEAVTTTDDPGGGDEDAALEAEAREMGWVPEDEWRGDKKPAKFKTAREFVEAGQTILPIVQKRAKDAEAKLEAFKKEAEERFARMERMNDLALKKQRAKLETDFDARLREAVKFGDEEGYDKALKDKAQALKDLEEEAKPVEKDKTQAGALSPAEVSALAEWRADNKWFQSDRKLTALMDAEFEEVTAEMPGATFAQRLEEARNRVAETFPDKFGAKTSAKRAGAVEGGSRIPGGGQKGRMADKLGAEERKQATKDVAEGLYKDVEAWARVYFNEEE
jgi:hypothetical protein